MSDGTRDASVRLSADVDPYRRDVAVAAAETDKLSVAVDRLSAKLDGLTKRAGKKLLLFGAGGATGIAGVTKEAAAFEKQLSTLNATAAITDKHMSGLTKNVTDLTKKFPVARGEAVELVTTLSKLGVTSSKEIGKLSESMVKLSAATGESLGGLTTGMVELGRQMGTLSAGSMDQFANALVKVSTTAGVSASNVLSFAQAIAPAARAAGMSEQALLGVSAAFQKAGQDGYAAANTFNSMLADVTRKIATGSPEIAKYSNLLGVTVEQFQSMDKADALVGIFEAISKQGPNAIKTLDRLGYDGVRTLKSIQAVSQSGGLREAIAQATGAYQNTDALNKGSAAAMDGMTDSLQRLSNAFQELATIAGGPFLKAFTPVVELMGDLARLVTPLASVLAGVGAKLSGVATAGALFLGSGLLMGGKLGTIATARYALNSSLVRGARQGFRDGQMVAMGGVGPTQPSAFNRWWNRPLYLAGMGYGQAIGAGGGPGWAGRVIGRGVTLPFNLARGVINAQGDFYRDARIPGELRRPGLLSSMGAGGGMLRGAYRAFRDDRQAFMAGFRTPQPMANVMNSRRMQLASTILAKGGTLPAATVKALEKEIAAATKAVGASAKVQGQQLSVQRQLTAAIGSTTKALLRMDAQLMVSGMGGIAKGGWNIAKGLSGAAMGMVGGPWMAGIMAGGLIAHGVYKSHKEFAEQGKELDGSAGIDKVNVALGRTTEELGSFSRALRNAQLALPKAATMGDVAQVSGEVMSLAKTPGRKLVNEDVKNFKNPKALAAWLQSQGITDPAQMQLYQADIAQQYSKGMAQDATDLYFQNQAKGSGVDYSAYFREVGDRQNDGGIRTKLALSGSWGGSGNAKQMINEAFDDIDRRNAANTSGGKTKQYADQQSQNEFIQLLAGSMNPKLKGDEYRRTTTDAVRQYENRFLGEKRLGYNSDAMRGAMIYDLGDKINDPKAREKYISDWLAGKAKSDKGIGSQFSERGISAGYVDSLSMASMAAKDSPTAQKIRATKLGAVALDNRAVQTAVNRPEDANAQYRGIQELYTQAKNLGSGFADTDAALQRLKTAIQDPTDELYKLANAAQALNSFQRQSNMHYSSRSDNLDSSVKNFRTAMSIGGPDQEENRQKAREELEGAKQSYYDYMVQIVQAQKNFRIQMDRAEEDRTTSLARNDRDFNIQMTQASDDFHRGRLRQERDFGIQMKRMSEDAAKSYYDPWKRVYAQYTSDAGTLLLNLQDQNDRLKQQTSQLNQVSRMGLSKDAINTLQLSNPDQAQQLNELIQDLVADPAMIARINKEVSARLAASGALVKNEHSEQFQRTKEDYTRGLKDAEEDFQRGQKRANEAHDRMLTDMADDWAKQTGRAIEDLARMSEQIYGKFGEVMQMAASMVQQNLGALGDATIAELNRVRDNNPELFKEDLYTQAATTAALYAGDYEPQQPGRMSRHAAGGIMTTPHVGMVAEAGPETIIPLNQSGQSFLAGMYKEISKSLVRDMQTIASPVTYRGGGGGTTTIDASTNFTGPITVQADDPNRMLRELEQKKRISALTRPKHRAG